ncbi:hypothetical protein R84981_001146 [Carnimonas sp. R-84981]|uniref:hypothetical protein n=1 Tax=Carnimonas bestiolae TaxID=3402172 RepID=UPI003EDBFD6B
MSRATVLPASDVGRQKFIALRDELRARHRNDDITQVWDSMMQRERSVVLKAADISPRRSIDGIERFNREEVAAIRDAIGRMGRFANGLKDRCQSAPHPSASLATEARKALDSGDIESVKHFLALIEAMA